MVDSSELSVENGLVGNIGPVSALDSEWRAKPKPNGIGNQGQTY